MQINSLNNAVVWTQDNCQYCGMAKALLKNHGYIIEERKIGIDGTWSKKDLLAAVPDARSVPQIFINGKYVGGYGALKELLYSNDYTKDPKVE